MMVISRRHSSFKLQVAQQTVALQLNVIVTVTKKDAMADGSVLHVSSTGCCRFLTAEALKLEHCAWPLKLGFFGGYLPKTLSSSRTTVWLSFVHLSSFRMGPMAFRRMIEHFPLASPSSIQSCRLVRRYLIAPPDLITPQTMRTSELWIISMTRVESLGLIYCRSKATFSPLERLPWCLTVLVPCVHLRSMAVQ